MSVKGYILLRANGAPAIPRYLRGLTGPYLFLAEAEQARRVISAATGIACQIYVIDIRRILGEVIRFGSRFIIGDVWNIRPVQSGFSAEVMIGGKQYVVRREGPEDVWHCADLGLIAPVQDHLEATTGKR